MPTARISTRVLSVHPECSFRMVAHNCLCQASPAESPRRYLAGMPIFSEIWLMALPCRLKFPSGIAICTLPSALKEITGRSLLRWLTPMGAMKSCAIRPSLSRRLMVSMTSPCLPSIIRRTLLMTTWLSPCCFCTGAVAGMTVASIFLVFKVVDKLQSVLMACPACFSKFRSVLF